ncbi:50S ribosomal protein L11 methyltransferase [Pediococcus acidilactici]|uniref:50S ribosomal protein L11 methyltransferase n=1 Tax=Pediococcus acidilactici TaxID=1254 RepID=UPI00132747D7|nr:50S ribosomal protein L11 methyltransferase [Pediococcus acidilactici]KAF0365249.1 50S ribosomal protein L11 methyltransferase [Pediococcus acidilactici]KAF0369327.1 50S ribosomal protein L11 methyltransferase [Pediococcus acidilactici]KAF0419459.1 50S ribosomal protein L11 methyltransferase [Pediococcus acidilactici]KAF0423985.1 50S ribosomal protein L11 methyltransferase [Pediococcus acidilactici]KAF0465126.1 50S ribosomal protein L11 methyltransferase [Pediococcus acidilactici]
MKWTEVNVKTTNEAVEAVSSIFDGLDAVGVKIEDALDFKNYQASYPSELYELKDIPHITEGAIVSAYYPESTDVSKVVGQLKAKLNELPSFGLDVGPASVTTVDVQDDDWATAWKKYYHPVRITRYLTVKPGWSDYQASQPDEKVISLDPGRAFGTGTHPTTRLCLQAMEMIMRGNETVYDVGTGSGVLSIAAKLLGAAKVEAFDVDDDAIAAAQENFDLNPIAKSIAARPNDLLEGIKQPVDLIVANILSDVLVPMIPQAKSLLNKNGWLVMSGIIDDKLPLIQKTLAANDFKVNQVLTYGEWRGVIASHQLEE